MPFSHGRGHWFDPSTTHHHRFNYSALIPAFLISTANFAVSLLMKLANSCGLLPTASTSALANRALVSGRFRISLVLMLIKLTIAGDVAAGISNPYQFPIS